MHLTSQARTYGSLRNISVSIKEMVHRLHKAVVPHTNKKSIIRDLMGYQRELHGLRFAFEAELEENPNRDDGLCELARLGLLDSSYFESSADLLARGLDLDNQIETDFLSGSSHIFKITCHSRLQWAALRCPHLPHGYLSDIQLIELHKAYEASGTQSIQTNHKVTYYNKVSYIIQDRAQLMTKNRDITQDHEQLMTESDDMPDDNDEKRLEMWKVIIKVDDVIEFLDASPDSFRGRGFGRVAAIMVHERMVFLVITWIIATGRMHPHLPLYEFEEVPLFRFAAFHPLTIIDHPRFVNHTYFAKLDGKLYLNDWVFDMV